MQRSLHAPFLIHMASKLGIPTYICACTYMGSSIRNNVINLLCSLKKMKYICYNCNYLIRDVSLKILCDRSKNW